MKNATRSSRDARAATIDLSESNHDNFRETVGTASSTHAAGIDVNPVLHHFPDERRIRCMASSGTLLEAKPALLQATFSCGISISPL